MRNSQSYLFIFTRSLVLLFCFGGMVEAEELTVAFWNVENLFDNHRNTVTPREDLFIPSALKEKLRKDGEIIRELNADILGLMEVENRSILQRLIDEELADMGYKHVLLIEANDERGIDVAMVSRKPFLAMSYDVPDFYRGILGCRFVVEGQPFYVLVNHWKSRFNNGSDLRMNCSKRVVEIVNELIPEMEGGNDVPVIIGGDFNDNDHDPSVMNLEDAGLINTLKSLPSEQRWTLPYHNREQDEVEFDSFDHIFINKAVNTNAKLTWLSSAVIRPERMTTQRTYYGKTYLWPDDDHDVHIGYSDHFPVLARFRVGQE